MIDRNDMLELTRRLTPERSSVGRIAGAYFDAEGYVDVISATLILLFPIYLSRVSI